MTDPAPPRRRTRAYHPLLFAAFPVLFLFAENLNEDVTFGDLVLPLVITLAVTGVLFALGTRLLRSAERAAVVVSAWAVLFFSYGHVWLLVRRIEVPGGIGPRRILFAVWALLAVGAVLLVIRPGRWLPGLTRGANVVGAALVAINVGTIVLDVATSARPDLRAVPAEGPVRAPPDARDVYYVIFDRYAGAQTLERHYGYDNEPFLEELRHRGFFVPEAAWGNYPRSTMSMASSLNMRHLPGQISGEDPRELGRLYDAPASARFLKGRGYRYINIGSWWSVTRKDPYADLNLEFDAPSRFTSILLETTMLQPVNERFHWFDEFKPRHIEFRRIPWQFEQIAAVARDRRPTFTFAHILAPHEPFVFADDGSFLTVRTLNARSRRQNYVGQLRYINTEILQLIDRLLAVPEERRPIILLQSDEGPEPLETNERVNGWADVTTPMLEQKMRIFMASYFPGAAETQLYEGITPVNSFRVLFNAYFDAGLALLPDATYVRRGDVFEDVTGRLRALDAAT